MSRSGRKKFAALLLGLGLATWAAPAADAAPGERPAGAILLNSGPLDPLSREALLRRGRDVGPSEKILRLVHYSGPIRPEWYEALEETGVQIVTYIPENSYLVYGGAKEMARFWALADSSPEATWEGAFLPEDKIAAPGASREEGTGDLSPPDLYAIQLIQDPASNAATLRWLDAVKLEAIRVQFAILNYIDIIVRIPPSVVKILARFSDVISVQPYAEPTQHDERQDQILAGNLTGTSPSGPGFLAWLASKGFTQAQFAVSGFAVDVCDSGLDNGTVAPNHFGLYTGGNPSAASRVAYSRLVGTANLGSTRQGCDGHGTLNAHILAGYDNASGFPFADADGFHPGLGICPFVKVGSSVVFDPTSWTHPSYPEIQSRAYDGGARISSNSWGSASAGGYTIDAQAYDALVRDAQPAGSPLPVAGNQEMVILFSAGNGGPAASTVGSPGTAKNVITVGASENVQPFGGADGCSISDAAADNASDMASFSGRGPCADGRMKPDLVAPGTHVTGGVFQQSPGPPAGLGLADFCYDGAKVCGGPVTGPYADLFWPAGQQWTTASSGTSHACPAVAGAAALLRQSFLNGGLPAPSPAMTKAALVNAARYLSGAGAADTLWSGVQGMGAVDLGRTLDGVPRLLYDQRAEDILTATGQVRTFSGTVSDPTKPFRVTLAWTDAPGSTVSAAYKNDLNLTVTVGGNSYLGNVFGGATSVTGGSADARDNEESVFLPAGTSGPFTVTVAGANINSDGVPNSGGPLDQDFALIVYNASAQASVPPPPPVPDGRWVAGTPMEAKKGAPDGSLIHILWDVSACQADTYNIYSGPLSAVSSGGYDSYDCGLPPTGAADVSFGADAIFFVVVPVSGGVEGSHGLDSSGNQRPWSGVGHCSVTSQNLGGSCP